MGGGDPRQAVDRVDAAKPHRPEPLGHEELLREMDGAGVHRAVLVPPTWEADRNDTSMEAARLYPDRFRGHGPADLGRAREPGRMATWKDQPGMLGIRLTFHRGRYRQWLDDGTADWFWEAAERHGIPVMALAPHSLPRLGEAAARHPGLRLAIDHMGLNNSLIGKPLEPIIDGLIKLAALPNVVVKASALPCYSTESSPIRRSMRRSAGSWTPSGRNACSGAPTCPPSLSLPAGSDPVYRGAARPDRHGKGVDPRARHRRVARLAAGRRRISAGEPAAGEPSHGESVPARVRGQPLRSPARPVAASHSREVPGSRLAKDPPCQRP